MVLLVGTVNVVKSGRNLTVVVSRLSKPRSSNLVCRMSIVEIQVECKGGEFSFYSSEYVRSFEKP